MGKVKAGIIGSDRVSLEVMLRIQQSSVLSLAAMADWEETEGLKEAKQAGVRIDTDGVRSVASDPEIRIVFYAKPDEDYEAHAAEILGAGKIVINMTLSEGGQAMLPCLPPQRLRHIHMISAADQATAPIVRAISQAVGVSYAEIVACIASQGVGKEIRNHIDELTGESSRGLETAGGAERGKAIMILNPAEPPLLMSSTIHCIVKNRDEELIRKAVSDMAAQMTAYAPGCSLRVPPIFDGDRVTVMMQIEAKSSYLKPHEGDKEIMAAAAVVIGERIAQEEEE